MSRQRTGSPSGVSSQVMDGGEPSFATVESQGQGALFARDGALLAHDGNGLLIPTAGTAYRREQYERPKLGTRRRHGSQAPEVATPATLAEVLHRESINRRLLAAADAVAILVAALFTSTVVGARPSAQLLLLSVLAVLVAKLGGLYDRDDVVIHKATLIELPKLAELAGGVTFSLYVFRRGLMPGADSRELMLLAFGCSAIALLVVFRALGRRTARRLTPPERCLIIGNTAHCGALARAIASQDGVDLIGTVGIETAVESPESLHALVRRFSPHRLVIAETSQVSPEQTLELIHHAKVTGARVSLQPSLMEAVGGSVVFDELGGQTVLGIPRFGLPRSSQAVKRAFDVVISASLLVLSAPLLGLIALLIKLDSPGPALFRQVRVGRDGGEFVMFKFRSMIVNADELKNGLRSLNEAGEGMFKISEDPRITRVGRWIRRVHLDELPQLFNVVRGDMSLVGPRPLIVEEAERLYGFKRHRLCLTPGMTGRWQVLGTNATTLDEMSKLDVLYIANWSMWHDVRILIETAILMFARRGV